MDRFSFLDDYHDGGHPRILSALQKDAQISAAGYGKDPFSRSAADLIRREIQNPDASIYFISGGTQANLIALTAMLRPYESIIAADTAHIHVHETGAIEGTGHKINLVPSEDGKLRPEPIEKIIEIHQDEHRVRPRVVFISQPTELGTLYSKKELIRLSGLCRKNNLWLYVDGARLSVAVTAPANDLMLSELSGLADVFYIGGTKSGALAAEAIVIQQPEINENFRYLLKQRGGLLAKGRFFGSQFKELFHDGLYYQLGRHANFTAGKLAEGIRGSGFRFITPPETNQLFPLFPDHLIQKLKANFEFHYWGKTNDSHSVIRLVTSWATPMSEVDRFIGLLKNR